MVTLYIVMVVLTIGAIIGIRVSFGKKITDTVTGQVSKLQKMIKDYGIGIIIALFLLALSLIVWVLEIPTGWPFWIAVSGSLIYTVYNIMKGKELNWQAIGVIVIVAGLSIYLYHGPTKVLEGEGPLHQEIKEKGVIGGTVKKGWEAAFGKSTPKPALYVPSYQRIATGEFVGKGLNQDDKIKTGWMTPETVRRGDKIRYQFPKDTYIEVINSKGEKIRHEGPEQDLYFSSDFGQITFWASKGADVYVELWGMR